MLNKLFKVFIFLIVIFLTLGIYYNTIDDSNNNSINLTEEEQKEYIENFKDIVRDKSFDHAMAMFFNDYELLIHIIDSSLYSYDYNSFKKEDRDIIEEFIEKHNNFMFLIVNNSDFEEWVIDIETYNFAQNLFTIFDEDVNEIEKAYLDNDIRGVRKASLKLINTINKYF